MIIITDKTGGIHQFDNDNISNFNPNDVYAKKSSNGCFVLASDEGDLFNILDSTYYRLEKDKDKGKLKFHLRKCSEECYNNYSRFLRTKNLVDFHCARRSFV